MLVKNCPKKKQTVIQQPKVKLPPYCPSCKQNIWIELHSNWYCQFWEKNYQ